MCLDNVWLNANFLVDSAESSPLYPRVDHPKTHKNVPQAKAILVNSSYHSLNQIGKCQNSWPQRRQKPLSYIFSLLQAQSSAC